MKTVDFNKLKINKDIEEAEKDIDDYVASIEETKVEVDTFAAHLKTAYEHKANV